MTAEQFHVIDMKPVSILKLIWVFNIGVINSRQKIKIIFLTYMVHYADII